MKTGSLLVLVAISSVGVLACSSDSGSTPQPGQGASGSAGAGSGLSAGASAGGSAGNAGGASSQGGTAVAGSSTTGGSSSTTGGSSAGGSSAGGSSPGASGAGGSSATAGSAGAPPLSCDGRVAPPVVDQPIGWAAVAGDGVETTKGGLGGQEVTATSSEQLAMYAQSAEPLIIRIPSSLNVGTLNIVSNKSLIGVGKDVTLQGGLRVRPLEAGDPLVSNVVIRNLRIDAASSNPEDSGDGIHIERAHHVWVDHCEVFDASDGNLDVSHGSNWITVSWTKFHYTANAPKQDHRFSNLIGHSENTGSTDRGRLKVTYHHIFWSRGVEQRMPRVRFGQVHVFNNYINAPGAIAAVAAGTEAQLLVENNHFEAVNDPHFFHEGSKTAQIVANGNAYVATTGKKDVGQGTAFAAPYPYTLDPVEQVPCDVSLGAGPR